MENIDKSFTDLLKEVFGNLVKELREAEKMSQPDLARKASVSVSTISEIENFKANFTVTIMGNVLGAMNKEVREQFSIQMKKKPAEDKS